MNRHRNKKYAHAQRKISVQPYRRPFFIVGFLLSMAAAILIYACRRPAPNMTACREKLALLEEHIFTEEMQISDEKSPAGGQAGQAVFLSVCNTEERARVFCGTGADLKTAWKNAAAEVEAFLGGGNYDPVWLKADVVYTSDVLDGEELSRAIRKSRSGFFRYGIALDEKYETAFLEEELNGAKIYDYEEGGLDQEYLKHYLSRTGRKFSGELPEAFTVFQCRGWFCDEENRVYELNAEGLDYGRRRVEVIDSEYAKELILNASAFLMDQVREDGSFIYGIYPRFDREIENYNIVRHASTLWSLICRYRLAPDEELEEKIERTIDFMLGQVIRDSQGRAWLYEVKDDEIKLGGCGIAVVALTEYMDVFQNDRYMEICQALGEGILSLMDPSTGEYYHVLNGDFSRKEEFRTVYYDGEATFALCRLYGLTGDPVWLEAAETAAGHFIEADYTQYKDHWVAYSMNELTKYVTDRQEYYDFALKNAQRNLKTISERDTTYHTYLELLMATFEVYDRMVQNHVRVSDFDLNGLLDAVSVRANRQLNGYFYPEYAMYMKNPRRILNTFMVRHDGCRIRIDDVQHNIGGYYLYYKNYDRLVEYGMKSVAQTEPRD